MKVQEGICSIIKEIVPIDLNSLNLNEVHIKDMGIDSLAQIKLVIRLEELYKIAIDDDMLIDIGEYTIKTVADKISGLIPSENYKQ